MGNSLPPPAAIDLVGSFARRRGSAIEIVLWEPKLAETSGALLLKKGRRTVESPVKLIEDAAGRRLLARTPGGKLTDGIWSMRLRAATGNDEPVGARLLVQGERPVVLLWGAASKPSDVPRSGRRKAAAAVGRTLDRAVSVLPPEHAVQVRSSIRKAARRVLG